jgi:membrane protease YdiL (CAAX protease family)
MSAAGPETKMASSAQPLSLASFFAFAYGLMWTCFFTVARAHIPAATPLGQSLLLLGTFAPAIAAVTLTATAQGKAGVKALLSRVVQWKVAVRWYIFAVSYIAAIKLVVALTIRLASGAWPRFGHEGPLLILVAILFSTPFQAGEEIGWRGYALPRLTQRFGLPMASVVLGVIWACWHLPQFFIREADTFGQAFLPYVLQVTAFSVAVAWLWARTGRSLLLPMLMHAAANNSKDIVPSATPGAHQMWSLHASPVAWLTVAMLWICGSYFLARMRKLRIS